MHHLVSKDHAALDENLSPCFSEGLWVAKAEIHTYLSNKSSPSLSTFSSSADADDCDRAASASLWICRTPTIRSVHHDHAFGKVLAGKIPRPFRMFDISMQQKEFLHRKKRVYSLSARKGQPVRQAHYHTDMWLCRGTWAWTSPHDTRARARDAFVKTDRIRLPFQKFLLYH